MSAIAQTRGLTKHYGSTVGIEDLDLSIEEGEILGFLGPNGAGKTTVIRLLLGLLRPTAGTFDLFGKTIAWGDWRHRADIGHLPGDLRLPGLMTGRALIRFLGGFHPRVDGAWVEELARRFDVPLSRRIRSLSRGNLQKLGFILAVMHRPRFLILDEPTTGLDPLHQRTALETLQEMRREGCTVFFSSHHLAEVEKICDRVALVREGHLVAVEKIEDLRHRRLSRVEIRLAPDRTPVMLDALPEVVELKREGDRVILTVRGKPGPVLAALGSMAVEEIVWQPLRLEDHFFDLYEVDR